MTELVESAAPKSRRLSRLPFQAAQLWLFIIIYSVVPICWALIGYSGADMMNVEAFKILGTVLLFLPLPFMLIVTAMLYRRRLHDLNLSGFWLLLPISMILVGSALEIYASQSNSTPPLIASKVTQVVIVLCCLYVSLRTGSREINRYGHPRPKSRAERIFGWLGSAYSLCIAVLFLYISYGGAALALTNTPTQIVQRVAPGLMHYYFTIRPTTPSDYEDQPTVPTADASGS